MLKVIVLTLSLTSGCITTKAHFSNIRECGENSYNWMPDETQEETRVDMCGHASHSDMVVKRGAVILLSWWYAVN